jgi:hypothetical protein
LNYNFYLAGRLHGWPDDVPYQPSVKGKTMNRSLLIAALVAVGLAACGEKPAPAPAPAPKAAPAPAPAAAPAPTPAPAGEAAKGAAAPAAPDAMKKDETKK